MRHLSATMSAKTTLWMCVALAAAIVAAFLVVILGTPTKRADAAFPGKNGKIAFESWHDYGPQEIVTMKANGDNKTQLTNNRAGDANPAFSPNGRKIAFESLRSGRGDIFTMSANGTDEKRVTRSKSFDESPAWSPDGTKIAFRSWRQGSPDIYVINQDGSGLTRLTTSPLLDIHPAWSPDGTKIAFLRLLPNIGSKIYVMKAARESETNRPQRLITSDAEEEFYPAWSPNGTRIAFSRERNGNTDIYVINQDGTGLTRITTSQQADSQPAWSPDGTKIAFQSKRGSDSTYGIFVMKAAPESATNRPKRITGNQVDSGSPDWQPLR